jgi:hypothetical protein
MSFSGETRVLMVDGTTKVISEVEVADLVLAWDPETGETGVLDGPATHFVGSWVACSGRVDVVVSREKSFFRAELPL